MLVRPEHLRCRSTRRLRRNTLLRALIALISIGLSVRALAQSTESATPPVPNGTVQLNFPEQSELKLLVDYVSQRLGVKILYDESIANKKITVRAPQPVPTDSLLELLGSTLKMKGLALVEADVAGWKRIVATEDLSKIAKLEQEQPLADAAANEAITQAFSLAHVAPQRLAELIKPFLTTPGANTITLEEQRVLIVTDYAPNLRRITQLIETIDKAGPDVTLEFYTAQHVEAPALQKQISEVLTARIGAAAAAGSAVKLQITPDERTNQLLLVGTPAQVGEARELAGALDVPLGLVTEVYSFRYVEASRIDRLIRDLFDPLTIKRLYRGAVDQEDNLLIVSGSPAIHEKVRWLKESMDVESKRPGSAVQFYRLRYANAAEVLQTINAIQRSGNAFDPSYSRAAPAGRGRWNDNQYRQPTPAENQAATGPNGSSAPGAADSPAPPAQQPAETQTNVTSSTGSAKREDAATGLLAGAAQVTADAISNTIIVVADRAVQQVYADLITYLDRRRPQVMIEARVVIIDTSDDFSLGIELSAHEGLGLKNVIQFTSYGLSTINPTTGSLALLPGRGANWALVEPEAADAVLRALSSHRRSRIVSSPRVLVNDNATGTLASVAEVPYTSVNASSTVATTSFGGFAEAGTSIEVTPRITDDDHLQLDYVVTLNSFTGTGGDGVPPPRQTDEIASSVTIPDGYTVIVGGLNREHASLKEEGIPFLENIPLIKFLTSQNTKSSGKSTLFVFLRPVILREDRFEDLKYISDRDIARACDVPNFPRSGPVLVR